MNKQSTRALRAIVLVLLLSSMAAEPAVASVKLPYDRTCPVIYDNDYVVEWKRVSFGGWKMADGHEVPMFRDDPQGRALVATKVDARIATEEWWRALKNPALRSPAR